MCRDHRGRMYRLDGKRLNQEKSSGWQKKMLKILPSYNGAETLVCQNELMSFVR